MKVLILNGSPHANGNTSIAVNELVKTFEAQGVEISRSLVQDADVVLYLVDGTQGMNDEDRQFIEKCEEHPEKVNWMNKKGEPLPEDVKERLRKADKESRRHQDSIISQLYYTSPQFYSDIARSVTKRGGEMGIRQAFGFVFIEIWYSCKKELIFPIGRRLASAFAPGFYCSAFLRSRYSRRRSLLGFLRCWYGLFRLLPKKSQTVFIGKRAFARCFCSFCVWHCSCFWAALRSEH